MRDAGRAAWFGNMSGPVHEPEDAPEPAEAVCGRLGRFFQRMFPGRASSETSLGGAAVEGARSAAGRVFLWVLMGGIFTGLPELFSWEVRWLGGWVPRWWGGTPDVLVVVGAVMWLGCIFTALLLIMAAEEGEWAALNWLGLGISAGTCLVREFTSPVWVLVLISQGALHWFLHGVLVSRRRRVEWELAQERELARADRPPPPRLDAVYRGLPGFEDDGPGK